MIIKQYKFQTNRQRNEAVKVLRNKITDEIAERLQRCFEAIRSGENERERIFQAHALYCLEDYVNDKYFFQGCYPYGSYIVSDETIAIMLTPEHNVAQDFLIRLAENPSLYSHLNECFCDTWFEIDYLTITERCLFEESLRGAEVDA